LRFFSVLSGVCDRVGQAVCRKSRYRSELDFGAANDEVEYHFVPQNKEQETIGTLFADSGVPVSR
jgi:hypothetical protein